MGIEPTSEAWEASILPLYDARLTTKLAKGGMGRKTIGAACSRRHCLFQLLVPEAGFQVVVDQSSGLHEGVADGGADKAEAALQEVFA